MDSGGFHGDPRTGSMEGSLRVQDLENFQQLFSSTVLWQHGSPASFYISALFFSLCTRWERWPSLSTFNQLVSFQKPNSKFLGERISLAELESNVHPGQSTLARTNKVARGHL